MARKNTAHRPSQAHMEYVMTKDGRKVKNTAYTPSLAPSVASDTRGEAHGFLPHQNNGSHSVSEFGEHDLIVRERALDATRGITSPEVRAWVKKFGGDDVYSYTPIDQLSTESLIDYTAGVFALKEELESQGNGVPASVNEIVKACRSLPLRDFGVPSDGIASSYGADLDVDMLDSYSASVHNMGMEMGPATTRVYNTVMTTAEDGTIRNINDVSLGTLMDMGKETRDAEDQYDQLMSECESEDDLDSCSYARQLSDEIACVVDDWVRDTIR